MTKPRRRRRVVVPRGKVSALRAGKLAGGGLAQNDLPTWSKEGPWMESWFESDDDEPWTEKLDLSAAATVSRPGIGKIAGGRRRARRSRSRSRRRR